MADKRWQITVWATVFTLPYLYYTANLGPKTGFVYTGLCTVSMTYVYFCVGEVTGRTIEEINGFFMNGIPARKWKEQPRLNADDDADVTDQGSEKGNDGNNSSVAEKEDFFNVEVSPSRV